MAHARRAVTRARRDAASRARPANKVLMHDQLQTVRATDAHRTTQVSCDILVVVGAHNLPKEVLEMQKLCQCSTAFPWQVLVYTSRIC